MGHFFVLRNKFPAILFIRQNPHHPAQRFGRAPQQLIAAGEGRQVLWPHLHLAQTTDRYGQGTGNSRRGQTGQGLGLVVGDQFDPLVIVLVRP